MSQELTVSELADVLSQIQKLPPELQPRYLEAARRHMVEQNQRPLPAVTIQVPAPHSTHALSLGLLTLFAWVAAIGAYITLYDVLEPIYHGFGAIARALTPLAIEAIMGYALVSVLTSQFILMSNFTRALVASACVAIIGLCVVTELTAAWVTPAVGARARQGDALARAQQDMARAGEVSPTEAPADEGRYGKLEHERVQHAAVDAKAKQADRAWQLSQQQITVAGATTHGEAWLPMLVTSLGAIGSSASMVLLEAFLRRFNRKRA